MKNCCPTTHIYRCVRVCVYMNELSRCSGEMFNDLFQLMTGMPSVVQEI